MNVLTAPPPLRRHRWTVADLQRMQDGGLFDENDRLELIEGDLIDMAPIGSRHANVVDTLCMALARQLPAGYKVRVQNPIHLGELSEPQPDIAVVRDRSYAEAHPLAGDVLLVIEVADSTLEFDRDVKLPLYARHGIPETWLIDLKAGRVSLCREPAEGDYRQIRRPTAAESVSPGFCADVVLRVGDLIA